MTMAGWWKRLFWGALMAMLLTGNAFTGTLRVPAEWEPHAATWMQWPGPEEAAMRPAFADIIAVVRAYEPVHILAANASEIEGARRFLADRAIPFDRISFHIVPKDNAWLRDNGPVYVADSSGLRVQNWGFDGWGGNFGEDTGYQRDDKVPDYIGTYLGVKVADRSDYILERGNLEFNGSGILVLNWDCQNDRNPGMTRSRHEALLKEAFGLDRIIWAFGHDPEDFTTGHIDGIARFINITTIVIADYGTDTDMDLADECRAGGLKVLRYPGDPNWLVGNGFVAAMGDGSPRDKILKSHLASYFPGRDIHMIDARAIARSGGGIHCVTNDQPAPETYRNK